MHLEYEVEPGDLIAFATHQRQYFRVKTIANWIWFVYLVLIFAAIAVHSGDFVGTAVMVACFAVLFLLILKPYTQAVLKKFYSAESAAGLAGPRKFTLHDDGFSEQTQFRDTRYKWHRSIHIATTRDHLFIYVNKIQAFIIPSRAFSDQQAFVMFAGELKDRARQAIEATSGVKATF